MFDTSDSVQAAKTARAHRQRPAHYAARSHWHLPLPRFQPSQPPRPWRVEAHLGVWIAQGRRLPLAAADRLRRGRLAHATRAGMPLCGRAGAVYGCLVHVGAHPRRVP
jgi:hypothetical protein